MTDNHELLDRADRRLRPESKVSVLHMEGDFKLIADLRDALRVCDRDLATARTVTRRFVGGWAYNTLDLESEDGGGTWFRGTTYEGYEAAEEEAMTDAERAWLASAISPPASGEAPAT